MWKRKVYAFCLLLVCYLCPAQVHEELTAISSSIKDKLLYLKQESNSMKTQLEMLSKSLEQSENEQKILMEQLTSSSASLMTINEQLNDCLSTIEKQEQKLRTKSKCINVLFTIIIIRIILMIIGYILYIKGVSLPRWLDILL